MVLGQQLARELVLADPAVLGHHPLAERAQGLGAAERVEQHLAAVLHVAGRRPGLGIAAGHLPGQLKRSREAGIFDGVGIDLGAILAPAPQQQLLEHHPQGVDVA